MPLVRRKCFFVRRCDDLGSIVRDGKSVDHTWDVISRVTGNVHSNHDTRAKARAIADEWNRSEGYRKGIECFVSGRNRANMAH